MKRHVILALVTLIGFFYFELQLSLVEAGNSTNKAQGQIYDKCTGPGEPGPCKNYLHKWRFEPLTNRCTTFIWGGCEGNSQNRFDSEVECLYHCIGSPRKYGWLEGFTLYNKILISIFINYHSERHFTFMKAGLMHAC